jgi:hypothetical protein
VIAADARWLLSLVLTRVIGELFSGAIDAAEGRA